MFERYTEKARRSIFFARHEASGFASPYIEGHHLLLGLMREEGEFLERLGITAEVAAELRREIETKHPRAKTATSTSIDLPLSHESKRALAYGAEEFERLRSTSITGGHILLGLIREDGEAGKVLARRRITVESVREALLAGISQKTYTREELHAFIDRLPERERARVGRILEEIVRVSRAPGGS